MTFSRVFDASLRIAGGALAILMAVGSAVLEVFATPGPWYIPVLMAFAGNVFLAWFAVSTVDRWWAWLLPAVPWALIMLIAIAPAAEGDQLANSWTGLGTFAAGVFGLLTPIMRPTTQKPATQKMGVSGISH